MRECPRSAVGCRLSVVILKAAHMNLVRPASCFIAVEVLLALLGCENGPGAAADGTAEVVYVCTETQDAFVGAPQAAPLANPDTGRKTLVPAVYNPDAGRWQAMPPLKALDGNPGAVVSKDADQRLTPNGPTEGLRRLNPAERKDP